MQDDYRTSHCLARALAMQREHSEINRTLQVKTQQERSLVMAVKPYLASSYIAHINGSYEVLARKYSQRCMQILP
jgi:hypothetical protein